jgi:hypothetical protein
VRTLGVGDLDELGHLEGEHQRAVVARALLLCLHTEEEVVEEHAVSLLCARAIKPKRKEESLTASPSA